MFAMQYARIGANVRMYRRAKKLSQSELGHLAELTRTTISKMERGVGPYSMDNIFRVAKALNVGVNDLVFGVDAISGSSR